MLLTLKIEEFFFKQGLIDFKSANDDIIQLYEVQCIQDPVYRENHLVKLYFKWR